MSAFANSPAAPQPAPERPAPLPLVPLPRPRRSRRSSVLAAVLLAVAAAAVSLWLRPRQPAAPAAPAAVRTARVTAGTLRVTARLAGTTSAKNFANIVAPMMRGPDAGRGLVLTKLARAGAMVKKGEVVAEIDAQSIKDHVDDVQALVDQADADVRKRRAEQVIDLEGLSQNLRQAKANLDKVRLDLGAAEIRTAIDREQLKLDLAEAEAQYNEMRQDIQTAAASDRAELRILEITRLRHERHRDRHKVDVTRFTVHAPIGGLVVMTTVWRGGDMGQVQEGDQLSPGQPFMKIVDPASMQVEATINQAESENLRIGQSVAIGFDAFPGLTLPGRVRSVGALALGGWRENYYIRNIPVKVDILGQDARVIPDLSASADVLLEQRPNVLLVPAEAVRHERGREVVYVRQAGTFRPRDVDLGAHNYIQYAVASGLKSGDIVELP